jgi:anti-anti-sigma factor
MSIDTSLSSDGKTLTIRLPKSFDLSISKEFRTLDKAKNREITQFIIDFSGTDHMDSSALGMLLLLREELGGDAAHITLSKCSANIRDLLRLARFEDLFNVA